MIECDASKKERRLNKSHRDPQQAGFQVRKVNAKQSKICAIAAFALFFAVGKAFLGWRFNKHFFTDIFAILSMAFVAFVLVRDRH